MVRIYIVEDDTNIAEIESFALKSGGYEAEAFASASAFYERVEIDVPDLIILDVMLPDEDGLTILRKLREREETSAIPIMMITAKTTEIDKVKGLDMGADDYMIKPFGVMELISRVKALLRRIPRETADKVYSCGKLKMDDEKHVVKLDQQKLDFTYKEYELLKLLLQKAEAVVSREEILEKVWGTDFEGESRTLDMHIKTLRKKLGDQGDMVKTVRNVGYILSQY